MSNGEDMAGQGQTNGQVPSRHDDSRLSGHHIPKGSTTLDRPVGEPRGEDRGHRGAPLCDLGVLTTGRARRHTIAFDPEHPPGSFEVTTSRIDRCDVLVEPGCAPTWNDQITARLGVAARAWFVVDERAWDAHAAHIVGGADDPPVLVLKSGERHKNMDIWRLILEWFTANAVGRRDCIVAVGGGVCIDTVGFAASAYMRGVPYLNIPTTTLAQVDAAIGGKVAVNSAHAKNLIGAFHQPIAVLADPALTNTVDARHHANGLAEAAKVMTIASVPGFEFMTERASALAGRDLPALTAVVRGACMVKAALLADDPYERDLDRVLNFGHAVGHAIETSMAYDGILHGEAVSIGMCVELRLGVTLGITDPDLLHRVGQLLTDLGLPTDVPPDEVDGVIRNMSMIEAIRGGSPRFVIPTDVGDCTIVDAVAPELLRFALAPA